MFPLKTSNNWVKEPVYNNHQIAENAVDTEVPYISCVDPHLPLKHKYHKRSAELIDDLLKAAPVK